ncbi:MAG: multidrug efflux RND transporter permease subunit [Planctomycetaceae bacterium]|nr:multidrug efflux RND transporter permease subunit [Planctomycetaceae bacterium]
MLSNFFIQRPIFANVIAIITILIGAVALYALPIEQYPEITPPTVRVSANYPGADAKVVSDTVASPIEQQVNGVENMLYMTSTCSADGSYSLTVTFEIGTDLDDAQVLVQNRVALAEALLPEEVKRQGVTVRKQSTNIIKIIALTSTDPQHDNLFLSNFATLRVRDELVRVPGVGDANVFGTGQYSMRVWLDPQKLKARSLTTAEVTAAIAEQNVQVAAGRIGQPPSPKDQAFQYTVSVLGRLSDVEQFKEIIVKTGEGVEATRLKDVATIELGAQTYDQFNLKKGKPTASIGIYQLPGANALDVAEQVTVTMEKLKSSFPEGVSYETPLDTTKFVSASIHEVWKTLFEAGVLVLVVILLFLQDWRAILIPATTVPVTIVGAFAAMYALGFTVNILTLFGLVLAIGIVVDDAIVIVENATHHLEEGMKPKPATIKAMSEVLGPIIGITLVLLAVFIPSAFFGGITGQLYRQFALTIAATALISAINAVTLKPAQSALWLRPPSKRKNFFFRGFNKAYDLVERIYTAVVRVLVRHVALVVMAFAGLIALTGWLYQRVPTGFFPTEDQGYIFISVQLPDAASQPRTQEVMREIDKILTETAGVADWITIGGLSLLDNSNASNTGTLFVTLKDWDERLPQGRTLGVLLKELGGKLAGLREAIAFPFPPPAIRGLGVRAGFQMQIEDRADVGLSELQQVTQAIVDDSQTQTGLSGVNSTFRPGVPQLFVDVDRTKVKALNVPLATVFGTLQAYLGSTYVNDFNKFGRTYQVRVQADTAFRSEPDDIRRLEVRNTAGAMIPLGAMVEVRKSFGPQIINRHNLYPTAQITGEPAPGYSSGEALDLMEQIAARNLPRAMGYDWAGMAYQEVKVRGGALLIFLMAVLLVYLVLAAQYENWFTPLAVIIIVPLGILGAVAAVGLRNLDNNLYTQIGIVLIIALASKNAILVVEFSRDLHGRGKSIREAAVEAARLRLRPILMTSFAFILGVLPLVVADGPGAAGQQALGTAVFGGMIASTVLTVFFVPTFFVIFQGFSDWWSPPTQDDDETESAARGDPQPAGVA